MSEQHDAQWEGVIESMHRHNEVRRRELAAFFDSDTRFHACAQSLMDDLLHCVDVLANYETCRAHDGEEVQSSSVAMELTEAMETCWERIFGEEYVGETAREMRAKVEESAG